MAWTSAGGRETGEWKERKWARRRPVARGRAVAVARGRAVALWPVSAPSPCGPWPRRRCCPWPRRCAVASVRAVALWPVSAPHLLEFAAEAVQVAQARQRAALPDHVVVLWQGNKGAGEINTGRQNVGKQKRGHAVVPARQCASAGGTGSRRGRILSGPRTSPPGWRWRDPGPWGLLA